MQIDTTPRQRAERAAYLAEALAGLYSDNPQPAPAVGGRRAALQRLRQFDVQDYARTRNHTTRRGVSELSPYIRHGAVSLVELRDYVLTHYAQSASTTKYVNELAWRAFWQIVYAALGDRIFADMEQPKYPGYPTDQTSDPDTLPADILTADTGLVCIDESLDELYTAGYMHNHARMWVAAYLQHWRRIGWYSGASLFYRHLLDGDPASNTLSWQWVGSTFSHKPYYFNRQNVERLSDGDYCRRCPLAQGVCPFDASYETLAQQLFGMSADDLGGGAPRRHTQQKGKRKR